MPVTHLSGRHARIDISIDGLTFTRAESDAAKRGSAQRRAIAWDDLIGAEIETLPKRRAVLRVRVAGAPAMAHHGKDPHAMRVPRKKLALAHGLVDEINAELEVRRRWRRHSKA